MPVTDFDPFSAATIESPYAFYDALREQAPGIMVEVVASDELRDLIRREADIAIRHAQPTQELAALTEPDP